MAPTGSRRNRARRDVLSAATLMLAVCAPPVAAQSPLPKAVGLVNDFANVIDADRERRIDSLAQRVRAVTRGEMVTVTLPDLGGRPVEEVALRLGREWKVGADAAIGDAARNAGVVILLVPKESSADGKGYCRIEVGQGAEGFITDAEAGDLCRDQISDFRAREYGAAAEAIATAVAEQYAAGFGVDLEGDSLDADALAAIAGGGSSTGMSVASVLQLVGGIFLLVLSFLGVVFWLLFRKEREVAGAQPGKPQPSGKRRKKSRAVASNVATGSTPAAGWSSNSSSSSSSSRSSSWGSSSGSSFGGGGGFSGGGGGSSW